MKKKTLKYYKEVLEHMEYSNNMAPFPVFDTEYVDNVKKHIIKMEKEDYNSEPVVACRYCKSLYITTDELDNNYCFRCGSVNSLLEFSNINKYLKFKNKEDSDE